MCRAGCKTTHSLTMPSENETLLVLKMPYPCITLM